MFPVVRGNVKVKSWRRQKKQCYIWTGYGSASLLLPNRAQGKSCGGGEMYWPLEATSSCRRKGEEIQSTIKKQEACVYGR